jgi:hypothetical protein
MKTTYLCDCTCADQCWMGKVGIQERCVFTRSITVFKPLEAPASVLKNTCSGIHPPPFNDYYSKKQ